MLFVAAPSLGFIGMLCYTEAKTGGAAMRVLFVGNSHTYFNDMPESFARMGAALLGERPEVTMLAFSGRPLSWHREEYFSLRFALLYGGYDYCVLQQQAHPFPPEEETRAAVARILALCRAGGVRPVLFMTWAQQREPELSPVMSRFYRSLAAETGALLAPVGELFAHIQKTHPEIELFWQDGAHASPYGSYLSAAVFASLLCAKRDLSATSDEGVDFGLDFAGENGLPLALEQPAQARIRLDPVKAGLIRRAVEQWKL